MAKHRPAQKNWPLKTIKHPRGEEKINLERCDWCVLSDQLMVFSLRCGAAGPRPSSSNQSAISFPQLRVPVQDRTVVLKRGERNGLTICAELKEKVILSWRVAGGPGDKLSAQTRRERRQWAGLTPGTQCLLASLL